MARNNKELIQGVIAKWNENKTSGEIAYELGITRARVMGIVFRETKKGGLVSHSNNTRKAVYKGQLITRENKQTIKRERSIKISDGMKRFWKKKDKVRKPPTSEKEIKARSGTIDDKGKKTIYELNRYDCRYICSDNLYCADPVDAETSWCKYHRGIVYIPADRIKVLVTKNGTTKFSYNYHRPSQ